MLIPMTEFIESDGCLSESSYLQDDGQLQLKGGSNLLDRYHQAAGGALQD